MTKCQKVRPSFGTKSWKNKKKFHEHFFVQNMLLDITDYIMKYQSLIFVSFRENGVLNLGCRCYVLQEQNFIWLIITYWISPFIHQSVSYILKAIFKSVWIEKSNGFLHRPQNWHGCRRHCYNGCRCHCYNTNKQELNHSETSADMLTMIPRVKTLDKVFKTKMYHLYSIEYMFNSWSQASNSHKRHFHVFALLKHCLACLDFRSWI